MSGTGTGRGSASLRREKACYRKKATSFPKRNRKQTCNEREEKDTDFPETCKTTGNSCLICQAHNGMLKHSFAEKSEEKSKAAAMPAQRNGR